MRTYILIVEDSATQAAQLEETLRGQGYETQTAVHGGEALELAGRLRPALIVSDVRMPVMDGFQLCRAIKQDAELCRIPVILLTSLSSPADVLSALEAGADFHIPKPYLADYLLEIVGGLLAHGGDSGRTELETVRTVTHDGIAYQISASPEHVLRLLLSTYEVAIQQNRDLLSAREELRSQNVILEEKVRERTANLMAEIAERGRTEEKLAEQLDELHRWHDAMLGREDRVQELKREVNELCRRAGETVRYPSQEVGSTHNETVPRA